MVYEVWIETECVLVFLDFKQTISMLLVWILERVPRHRVYSGVRVSI